MKSNPKTDLCFQVKGKNLPVDHGFALYGALSQVFPIFHNDDAVGLKLIRGRYIGDGLLDISPHSELGLRLPVERVANYLNLAGESLQVLGHDLQVGLPKTRELVPAVALYSHLVTTKNCQDRTRFEEEVGRQMDRLSVKGKLTVGGRHTFQVHGKQMVGYSVLVSELTAEESISIQEHGLGGRRKMGCGFFEPFRR